MAKRRLPDRRCGWHKCGRLFRPKRTAQECCSLTCKGALAFERNPRTLILASAISTVRKARRRVEASVIQKYGRLSQREVELFNLGRRLGYKRGYTQGWQHRRRDVA